MNYQKVYLIVDNETDEVLAHHYVYGDARSEISVAKTLIKERYPTDRIVRAVCEFMIGGRISEFACGKTFAEAESNLKKGIVGNWADF